MIKSKKISKERNRLKKGTLVYKLEIAVNPRESTVEYIVESIDEVGEVAPLSSTCDYMTDFFDEEDLALIDSLYEFGES